MGRLLPIYPIQPAASQPASGYDILTLFQSRFFGRDLSPNWDVEAAAEVLTLHTVPVSRRDFSH